MNIIEQYRELERRAGPMLKAAGLTLNQYQAAEAIMALGRPTMGEVGEYLYNKPSTITAVVDHLERGGFIQRTRDAEDRRAIRLAISNPGWFNEQRYAMQRLQEAIQGEVADAVARTA